MSRAEDIPWPIVGAALLALAGLSACGQEPEPRGTREPPPTWPDNNSSSSSNHTSAPPNNQATSAPNNTTEPTPTGAPVGAACAEDGACAGSMVCDSGAPGGYCRPRMCGEECAARGGICGLSSEVGARCWAPCPDEAPREGYACAMLGPDQRVLAPEGTRAAALTTFDELTRALDVLCESTPGGSSQHGPTREFTFTIGGDTNGFLMVPHVRSTQPLYPIELRTPSGARVDLLGDYVHHNTRRFDLGRPRTLGQGTYGLIGFDWPIQVPYAPSRRDLLEPGEYQLRVAADASACLYVLPSQGQRRVDLNLYFVGLPTLDAMRAPQDEDLQQVLGRVGELFAKVDIEIGQVRYLDVPPEVAETYTVLRDHLDIQELTAHGFAHGISAQENLSVDLFIVRSISLAGGAVVGFSGGVPGAAGMHGNGSNGLVFSLEGLGQFNYNVAHIMAHEIAHYLGLRHTTELAYGTGTAQAERLDEQMGLRDPIEDTEHCEDVYRLGSRCPDFPNLMFPSAPPPPLGLDPELTEGQGDVLRANPLTYGP